MKAQKMILTGSLLSILAFSSLSSAFAVAEAPADATPNVTDVNIFIDSSIQGHDREVILDVMRTLDPADRENVTYRDANGKYYANKPVLMEGIVELKNVGDNLYETPDGQERFALPNDNDPRAKAYPEGQLTLENAQPETSAVQSNSSCTINQKLQGNLLEPLPPSPLAPHRQVLTDALPH
ncbi:MAG: hypothetical protein WDZ91_07480 [Paenibacillaceae bacterium]